MELFFHKLKLFNVESNKKPIYLLKVNNKDPIKRYEISSKLTIKTPERRQWRHISTTTFSSVSIIDFKQGNVSWE